MIFPKSFCSNPDTLDSNSFQSSGLQNEKSNILAKAQSEFNGFQRTLLTSGFQILKFEEDTRHFTPDALFPNNWFCHLPDGRVFLFPMYPKNRRNEFREDIIAALRPKEVIDLRPLADKELFLEGTGSLILDHYNKKGFACLSPRTSPAAVEEFSRLSGYRITTFDSVDTGGKAVYHTNVMMTMSEKHAVICMESVHSVSQKEQIESAVKKIGKTLVPLSYNEMNSFAGNMLFIRGRDSNHWACSTRAYESLSAANRNLLSAEAPFLHSGLNTIETFGGGGARCLLAEVFNEPV